MRAAVTELGVQVMKPFRLALLVESELRLGNFREGLASVREGLHLTHTTLDRFCESELWRLKGELLLAQSKENKKTAPRRSRVNGAHDLWSCAPR